MPRGGKRSDAGSKPILDYFQKIAVACEYDQRMNEIMAARMRIAEVKAIPNRRLRKLRKYREFDSRLRKLVYEQSLLPYEIQEHLTDTILDAADELKERKALLENRNRLIRGKRPYRVRDRVTREVAEWASKKFGKKITPRYVAECRRFYRTELKQDF